MSRRDVKHCPMCHSRCKRTEMIAYKSTDGRVLCVRSWHHAQYGFRKGGPPCVVTRTYEEDQQKGRWAL